MFPPSAREADVVAPGLDADGAVQPEVRAQGTGQTVAGNTAAVGGINGTIVDSGINELNGTRAVTAEDDSTEVEEDSPLAREAQAISDYAQNLRAGKQMADQKSLSEMSARAHAAMAQHQLKKAIETDNPLMQGQAVASGVGYARQALKNIGLYPPADDETMQSYRDVIAQARMMASGEPLNNVQKSDLLVSANTLIDTATTSVSNYEPTVTGADDDIGN